MNETPGPVKKFLYWTYQWMPDPYQKAYFAAVTGSLIVVICVGLLLIISHLFPDKALKISWGEFNISSEAAKANAKQAKQAADEAEASRKRIETIETRVIAQRDTIDAAFRNAEDAKRTSFEATQTLAAAQTTIRKMEETTKFLDTLTRAIVGHADALESLQAIAPGEPNFERAYNAVEFIVEHHAVYSANLKPMGRFPARFQADITNVPIEYITSVYPKMELREELETIAYVAEQARYSNKQKLAFLYPQCVSNANIRVRAAACKFYLRTIGMTESPNLTFTGLIKEHFQTNSFTK